MSPNPRTEEIVVDIAANQEQIEFNMKQDQNDEYVWTLSEELAELAQKELGEEPTIRETCLTKMRSWVKRQPRLAHCRTDNVFLLRFLRARKFNLEKACDNLENYIKMRFSNPDWFTEIDPTIPNVKELCNNGFSLVLPDRDADNRRVLFSYVDKIDVNKHINSDVMKVKMASIETLMEDEENQIRGITYIFYCKDISMTHCSIWTYADAHTLFGSCEKSIGVRHADINLVRLPFCLWAVVEFVKQLLSSKLKSRINLLATEEKAAKKFGESMLPAEIGGAGQSLEVMAAEWYRVLEQNRPNLLSMDRHILAFGADEGNHKTPKKQSTTSRGFWSLIPGM